MKKNIKTETVDIETAVYQVYVENHEKDILCTGSIWECERWIRKNGLRDTPYIIDRIRTKTAKTKNMSKKEKQTHIEANTHSESIKQISNKVEYLF